MPISKFEQAFLSYCEEYELDPKQQAGLLGLVRSIWGRPGTNDPRDTFIFDSDVSLTGVSVAPPLTDESRQPETGFPARYDDLGLLGVGGTAQVRRIRDQDLERSVACKILRRELTGNPALVSRFVEEARISAQLQHPGILPVHELGQLADGRLYFTMKEIQGETLLRVIRRLHQVSKEGEWGVTQDGFTFRRLIEIYRRLCEAMAYAHARGVVHQDLKPDNIMVDDFGELMIVDWGLAKVIGQSKLDHYVAGTPAYMPPEQADGSQESLDPRSDVYSLGATLYEILAGVPPYDGKGTDVLKSLRNAPPPSPSTRSIGGPVPESLEQICLRAMSREIQHRYRDAGELSRVVTQWLDGAMRREKALELIAEADEISPQIQQYREDAKQLRRKGERILKRFSPWDEVSEKRKGWKHQDEARGYDLQAEMLETHYIQLLRGALSQDPELPEAHERLASHYYKRHRQAEQRRNRAASAALETLLRSHARGRYRNYLRGRGQLTLLTNDARAQVRIFNYVEEDRRRVPKLYDDLGTTPVLNMPLEMGSYLVEISAPGRRTVHYPVFIERGGNWSGAREVGSPADPIYLPRESELSEEEVYVPAGWFWSGGDPEAVDGLPRKRAWVEGFAIRRFPITHRDYIEFLDDLVAQGRVDEAMELVPRNQANTGNAADLNYRLRDNGRFEIMRDPQGDLWLPDWPVFMISRHNAQAWCRWASERDGVTWRLPKELEWEKAARGVDGRIYPWGDFIDPTWCCYRDSHRGKALPVTVHEYPEDVSPYGVRGMGGCIREWCSDDWVSGSVHPGESPLQEEDQAVTYGVIRSSSWVALERNCRVTSRHRSLPERRDPFTGFRPVRSLG